LLGGNELDKQKSSSLQMVLGVTVRRRSRGSGERGPGFGTRQRRFEHKVENEKCTPALLKKLAAVLKGILPKEGYLGRIVCEHSGWLVACPEFVRLFGVQVFSAKNGSVEATCPPSFECLRQKPPKAVVLVRASEMARRCFGCFLVTVVVKDNRSFILLASFG
jgi:hypothetical protein